LAALLLDAVRKRSGQGQAHAGAVVIPPVMPMHAKNRWDPWHLRVEPEDM
jgi:hypothetical protein